MVTPKHTDQTAGVPAPFRLFVCAGEASSDHHAALLVESVRRLCPSIEVFGMGGSALRAAGAETVVDSETAASVMGLTELIGSLPKILGAFRTLVAECRQRRPDLAVLVDFPDFNLRLAKKLHHLGIPNYYYISPQLWAWRSGRVKIFQKYISKVATIFPFEEAFYREHGVDAEYVGHPYTDEVFPQVDRVAFLAAAGLDPSRPVIGLLPGSRSSEVERLLPPMLQGSAIYRRTHPEAQVLIPAAPTLGDEVFERLVGRADPGVAWIRGSAREVMTVARAAIVASGTTTVEAALAGVPFSVVYKLSPLTYFVARALVRGISHFAMVNLIAGEKVVEELLQGEVTPERLAFEIERLAHDEDVRREMLGKLSEVRRRLHKGTGKAVDRAAQIALELMERGRHGQ